MCGETITWGLGRDFKSALPLVPVALQAFVNPGSKQLTFSREQGGKNERFINSSQLNYSSKGGLKPSSSNKEWGCGLSLDWLLQTSFCVFVCAR